MAFDGRPDPNKGYEEKSPCTIYFMQFKMWLTCLSSDFVKIDNELLLELHLSSKSSSFNNSKIA